jgi:NAD+ kinase
MLATDAARFPECDVEACEPEDAAAGCELALVFGGDGTILRAAYLARGHGVPLLGINLGHMGFLAESEPDALPAVIEALGKRSYQVEDRMALDLLVYHPDGTRATGWALNDVSVEKASRERMIELIVAIDDEPLSTWAADGIVCATPTGSTAYAWSAGGPVVWPEVEAMIVVPISAHALFSRPLVINPSSEIDIELLADSPAAVAWCDGGRMLDIPPGARLEVRRAPDPVKLARLHPSPFTDRLVAKFSLPVRGWRGRDIFGSPSA